MQKKEIIDAIIQDINPLAPIPIIEITNEIKFPTDRISNKHLVSLISSILNIMQQK